MYGWNGSSCTASTLIGIWDGRMDSSKIADHGNCVSWQPAYEERSLRWGNCANKYTTNEQHNLRPWHCTLEGKGNPTINTTLIILEWRTITHYQWNSPGDCTGLCTAGWKTCNSKLAGYRWGCHSLEKGEQKKILQIRLRVHNNRNIELYRRSALDIEIFLFHTT